MPTTKNYPGKSVTSVSQRRYNLKSYFFIVMQGFRSRKSLEEKTNAKNKDRLLNKDQLFLIN